MALCLYCVGTGRTCGLDGGRPCPAGCRERVEPGDAVLAALPGTASEVIARTGLTPGEICGTLRKLRKLKVVRVVNTRRDANGWFGPAIYGLREGGR